MEHALLLPRKEPSVGDDVPHASKHLFEGRKFPQAIAHRGYQAKYPENTLISFAGAVQVGAQALETDIHLSKDGVVVLSHDGNLKRCYGRDEKIADCDWDYLSTLRTLKAPHTPLPRLKDLLDYLATPGLEDVWVLLDIKIDNDADDLMRFTADTIRNTTPGAKPWAERIVLGCWTQNYLPLCDKYLPGFQISHIGYNLSYARQFLKIPSISFNMLQKILVGPAGTRFLQDAKAAGRPVYVWTVNEAEMMRWSIRKQVDGVITDNPEHYLDVCRHYDGTKRLERLSLKTYASIIWVNIMATFFGLLFRRKLRLKAAVQNARQ
ncbi:MAG: hypothetical protein M1829_004110 [Trizodia sp. TS-e1964]|nr:MAG: hypothetical protein M1829_004110 [Trizodia sp. TS-e1964]